ncbi:MAG TPA: histidine kinase [Microbacterium sp.]|nr:histidine kinase [Microbacterium sp.]
MSSRPSARGRGSFELARGIWATWWYTAAAVLMFEVFVVAAWSGAWGTPEGEFDVDLVALAVGVAWLAATIWLLLAYRRREDQGPLLARRDLAAFVVCIAAAVAMALLTGSWLAGAALIAQPVAILNWPRGVRLRLVLVMTAVLVGVAVIDSRVATIDLNVGARAISIAFSIALPSASVMSLWWWDVLVAFDRARAVESRLAATQERLRVATDVHDLQGHHLQVIALQLELAEKLMARDPDAALQQIQAARVSVGEATQGTRDLATRFRSASLGDEIQNARDLLQAAGISAIADASPRADAAPVDVLGPVIRETTTNVLRHGGGRRARLALSETADGWRYEIVNDRAGGAESADGSGLEGIARRVADAGGTLDVRRDPHEFAVVVEIPGEGAR